MSLPYTAWLPLKPPSMNSVYQILYHLRRVEMKPEVRQFKTQVKLYLPPPPNIPADLLLAISLTYHDVWMTKEGKVRKLDLSNLEKVLLDAVCEHVGVDDSHIFKKESLKQEGEKVGISITISGFISP